MSDIMLNMSFSDGPARKKKKQKWFLKKMRYLEKKGYMRGKHNKNMHKMGQDEHDQTPCQNGAAHPPPPTSSVNRNVPHTVRLADVTDCSSKPSASTHSLPSLTVTVMNTGNTEQSDDPVSIKSSTSSHNPTATLPAAQTSAGLPTKYLAVDCEMVGAGPKGQISQLARCSIVSYEGSVVYDKFIKPSMPVTDYRTRWSGIHRRDLANATPYAKARTEILRLLTGKVVIGHAIHNDFKALGYTHPPALTRDTSRIPLLNLKAGFAANECASLKRLTKAIFNRDIQTGKRGHSSVEDAKATMELYKVVEVEWEKKLASNS